MRLIRGKSLKTPKKTTQTDQAEGEAEESKESQPKENPMKKNQPNKRQPKENQPKEKQPEKPTETKGKTDTGFKKPQTRKESKESNQTSDMASDTEGGSTDTDMDTTINNKHEREQAATRSLGKNKKKRGTYVSQAKQRNPFYRDSN